MQELVHNGSYDDDGRLALSGQARRKVLADRVVADRCHGRKKQAFAQMPVARLAHRCPCFAARAGLENPRRGARVGRELTGVFLIHVNWVIQRDRKINKLSLAAPRPTGRLPV